MDFFRRFQKPILIATSAIVISSFAFYGVFSVVQKSSSAPTKAKILSFKTMKGRKVYDCEVEVFEKLLQTAISSRNSPLLDQEHTFVNRWFEDRIAVEILKSFSSELIPLVKEKIEHVKNDRGYVHPKAPYISQHRIVSELSNEFGELHQKLRNAEEVTTEVVGDFLELFVVGSEFSSDLIRTFLIYQQQQLPQNQQDPSLLYRNFAHFGWKKPSDWIGTEGVVLLTKSFEHLYDLSLSLKYKPSLVEVQKKFFKAATSTQEEVIAAERALLETLGKEGIDEGDFWRFWQKWFVIENWMDSIGKEVIFDQSHLKQTYTQYLTDVNAEVYELPNELNFHDLFQMLEFQVYLDTISEQNPLASKDKAFNLELPQEFASSEELKKRVPELVQFSTPILIQKIAKQELESKVSLRDMWTWQESDRGWNILNEQFPFLKSGNVGAASRIEQIKTLTKDLKKNVDDLSLELACAEYLANHPAEDSSLQKENLHRDMNGNCYLKKGKIDVKQLEQFLERGEIGKDIIIPTGPYFYRFKIIGPEKATILTFTDASRRGITKKILDKRLEKHYQTLVKSESPLVKVDGKVVTLQDCRLKVAESAFEPLLKSLKVAARTYDPSANENTHYAFRFCNYLEFVKKDLIAQRGTSRKIKESAEIQDIADLSEQWHLLKTHKKIPLFEMHQQEELPHDMAVVAWKDKFVLLKVNGTEENQERRENKINQLKKTLERTYLRAKIQDKMNEVKSKGNWDV